MSYTLPSLPYATMPCEPHFDKQTMEIHHTKHHQTYVNNANAALESLPEFANLPVEELTHQYWTRLPGRQENRTAQQRWRSR
ncbi:Mn dependent superoxide dismutase [Escherichia coli]|uniref:superoxide dismutase n=1 Tax=Escherichia coli TaxID=562 RepID=A0A376LHN6_ECOLX|nr:Mn dependent superoxide dismutase [Escherichia coli]